MNKPTTTLLNQVRTYTKARYNEGYSAVVECYSDEELLELFEVEDIQNLGEFVEYYAPIRAHREEIISTKF